MSPQQIAEAVRDEMLEDDHSLRWLGMQITEVGPGSATVTMTVRKEMLNAHALCHGGVIATLADSAFGYASNSCNEATVASGFDVNLIASARLGDQLTARATELSRSGRTGVYDVVITNQHDERIAVFRGRSYTAKGRPVVEGLPVGRQR